jgi:hypothetical protein
MISLSKKTIIRWTAAALTLTLVVGCSSLNNPVNQTGSSQYQNNNTTTNSSKIDTPMTNASASQPSDPAKTLLLNMMKLAQQGKVNNCDFPAKTTVYEDVEKLWGQADTTNYIAAAKGRYAIYSSHNVVFGINKGEQIFEVRSLASHQFTNVFITKVKEILGPPTYDVKSNGQEIIGYPAGPEFKIEMVFPEPTTNNPNPPLDHYNVLYPQGTINMMADDPGRQW